MSMYIVFLIYSVLFSVSQVELCIQIDNVHM